MPLEDLLDGLSGLGVTGEGGLIEDLFGYDSVGPALVDLNLQDLNNLLNGGETGLLGGLLGGDLGDLGGLLDGLLGGGGNPLDGLLDGLLGGGGNPLDGLLGALELDGLLDGLGGTGLGITDGVEATGGLLYDLLGQDPVGPLLIDLGLGPVNDLLDSGDAGLLGSLLNDLGGLGGLGGGLGGLDGLLGGLGDLQGVLDGLLSGLSI